MAKNIIICAPTIAKKSAYIATSHEWETLKRHWNLYRGNRYYYAKLASASSSDRVFTFTLNSEAEADYIAIARADLLVSSGDDEIEVEHSDNGSSWTSAYTKTITSGDLIGIRNQDYIDNFTSATKKYWRVTISGGSGAMEFSKLYLGKSFDFDVNASSITSRVVFGNQQNFTGVSGARFLQKNESGKNIIMLKFEGVTDAQADEFIREIVAIQHSHQGVFLWNPNENRLLNGHNLIHCQITDWSKKDVVGFPNWNEINVEFLELIG